MTLLDRGVCRRDRSSLLQKYDSIIKQEVGAVKQRPRFKRAKMAARNCDIVVVSHVLTGSMARSCFDDFFGQRRSGVKQ
jgi:hypothetical protein